MNTIQKHLQQKPQSKYGNSNIYKLKCLECPLQYVGQTERSFPTRYNEHTCAIKHNESTSTYTQYILNTAHAYKI
jgi:hypothetical protein